MIIYLYGVAIPAVYLTGWGKAEAGCTEDTPGTVSVGQGEKLACMSRRF